jgi:peroxiredoxin
LVWDKGIGICLFNLPDRDVQASLGSIGGGLKELLELGYQIVAISLDSPKSLKATKEEDKVNYLLLSDSYGDLAKAMGIGFQASINSKSILAKESDGLNSTFLLISSVFIVSLYGEVDF